MGHTLGNLFSYVFGVLLRGRGPHQPVFAHDIVRIQRLKIYTDLIEYNFVGDIKAPLLRCFPFSSNLKSEGSITTGQYMNYRMFTFYTAAQKFFS